MTIDDIRGVYSSSLLNIAVKRVGLSNPLTFGESNVKKRVVNVLGFKKPSRIIGIVSAIAVLIFLVGFISNRSASWETIADDLDFVKELQVRM